MKYENEVLSAITLRRSVRSFLTEPVPADALEVILRAGQAAPYVMPGSRHFTVVRNRKMISKMNIDAKEAVKTQENETLSSMCRSPGFDGTYGAPALILLSGNESTVQYECPCAASAQNMLLAAHSLGIASCWVYFPIFAFHGAQADEWRETLSIPAEYKPCISILLGYGSETAETAGSQDNPRYKNSITYV